jgi:hypothetical protein
MKAMKRSITAIAGFSIIIAGLSSCESDEVPGAVTPAVVTYTDIDPDTSFYSGVDSSVSRGFDLDGDQNIDLQVESYHWYYNASTSSFYVHWGTLIPGGNVQILATTDRMATVKLYGDVVREQDHPSWVNTTSWFYNDHAVNGFPIQTFDNDRYFAFRIATGNNGYHYGWIRISVDPSPTGTITVKDFAVTTSLPLNVGMH